MSYEEIRYAVEDRVATITLDRPERMNAFTAKMCGELIRALDAADQDDEVRVVIVTGAGRAFCAGADLGSGGDTFDSKKQGYADTIDTHRDGGGLVSLKIYSLKKPVIAAINGAAVGVGITMTLPMDVRIMAEGAKVGFVFHAPTTDACGAALRYAIDTWYRRPAHVARLRHQAMARRFSWDEAAARLERVYASVIGAREQDDPAVLDERTAARRSFG
jgi:enoyl-CoA hydratase/carnithine racemase